MDEREVQDALAALIREADEADMGELTGAEVNTFKKAGVLSNNAGLIMRLPDDSEFQITIVQTRRG